MASHDAQLKQGQMGVGVDDPSCINARRGGEARRSDWLRSRGRVSCYIGSIWRWKRNGEIIDKVHVFAEQIEAMHLLSTQSQRSCLITNADTFVVGHTNGAISIISKGGQEERRIDAHEGAVLSLKWNVDGTTLATAGADGFVKLWSRNGVLRSNVYQSGHPVTFLAWAPDSSQLLFASGKHLTIKHTQSSTKQTVWEGHDAQVIGLDWNRVNRLIVSIGAEDCYKVWDCFGRLLFKSAPLGSGLSSVLWCPSGEIFVVGACNMAMLCDKRGHVLSKENTKSGTFKALAWTIDGSQVALGCTNGAVMVGHIVERSIEWMRSKAALKDTHCIQVQDFLGETTKSLEFHEPVVHMSLGFGHLVVTTTVQRLENLLRSLCEGWRTDLLNSQHVGLSKDMLVLLDCSDPRNLKLFDTSTGKEMEQMIRHDVPIMDVDMNQQGMISDRMLLFIYSNSDLYIACIKKPCTIKLASLTTKALWSSDAHIVAAMVEQDLVVWLYLQAAFIDEDLLSILEAKECFKGKNAALHSFQANRFFVHYDNGAVVTKSMSPKPFLLFEYIYWEQAKKLCWVFKEVPLWASLAASAMNAKLYDIAQEAYTALGQIDKTEFIEHLKGQASEVVRKAEDALFTRQLKDSESVLLNAGLVYRAIKVNLRLLNWDRALEIALLHKKHVDTVLWKRGQYLSDTNQDETKDAFKNLKDQVPIDVETIKQNISEEKTREKNRKK
ncbi:hypothetical protein L7F22_006677 [Adiantum nelumboides]|nr:hypothetical protein [Adiantum nelumboides]